MRIGRKRTVLIEKNLTFSQKPCITLDSNIIPRKIQPLQNNLFAVELEKKSSVIIDPFKISWFKIDNQEKEKILKIRSILEIDDWLSDFKEVNVARIFFLNNLGKTLHFLDFDVIFVGYSIECDRNFNHGDLLKPIFSYKILE